MAKVLRRLSLLLLVAVLCSASLFAEDEIPHWNSGYRKHYSEQIKTDGEYLGYEAGKSTYFRVRSRNGQPIAPHFSTAQVWNFWPVLHENFEESISPKIRWKYRKKATENEKILQQLERSPWFQTIADRIDFQIRYAGPSKESQALWEELLSYVTFLRQGEIYLSNFEVKSSIPKWHVAVSTALSLAAGVGLLYAFNWVHPEYTPDPTTANPDPAPVPLTSLFSTHTLTRTYWAFGLPQLAHLLGFFFIMKSDAKVAQDNFNDQLDEIAGKHRTALNNLIERFEKLGYQVEGDDPIAKILFLRDRLNPAGALENMSLGSFHATGHSLKVQKDYLIKIIDAILENITFEIQELQAFDHATASDDEINRRTTRIAVLQAEQSDAQKILVDLKETSIPKFSDYLPEPYEIQLADTYEAIKKIQNRLVELFKEGKGYQIDPLIFDMNPHLEQEYLKLLETRSKGTERRGAERILYEDKDVEALTQVLLKNEVKKPKNVQEAFEDLVKLMNEKGAPIQARTEITEVKAATASAKGVKKSTFTFFNDALGKVLTLEGSFQYSKDEKLDEKGLADRLMTVTSGLGICKNELAKLANIKL